MPATLSFTAFLVEPLKMSLGLGQILAKDIPSNKFTFLPHPNMNHPAWCYGHLSLYPARMCRFLGRDDIADPEESWTELFQAGTTPVNGPGTYPGKNEIVSRFVSGYQAMLELLPEITDEDLARPTPNERYAQRFPRVGHAIGFMAGNHLMYHLGQVSAWRRCIGLGSVM